MSTFSSQPIVIDGKGHLLGRLASTIAKQVGICCTRMEEEELRGEIGVWEGLVWGGMKQEGSRRTRCCALWQCSTCPLCEQRDMELVLAVDG